MESGTRYSKLAIISFILSPVAFFISLVSAFSIINPLDDYLCATIKYCLIDDLMSSFIPLSVISGLVLSIISLYFIKKKNLKGKGYALISLISSIVIIVATIFLIILGAFLRPWNIVS